MLSIKSVLMSWSCLLNKRVKLLSFGRYAILLLVSVNAYASFQLESIGIILDESKGRVSFNIKNTSSTPILLVSKLQDLDAKSVSKQILISPPITRIDSQESQQVNFILKKGVVLTDEILLKASFEGVTQDIHNSAKMPIRQEIGFLLQPTAVKESKTPWEALKITLTKGQLQLENRSHHVIRLDPQLRLLPNNSIISLKNYYLMAGEIVRVNTSNVPTAIKITPLSRYGAVLADITLPVTH